MSEKQLNGSNSSETYEMLKALYDFQAVYPKTISFDEGEYFILYQTSVRQRNWWQVVSMKGNIGFVPSNYVMKLKVEPNFLISFLDSSIESLEQSKETAINGIIMKDDLLQRLKERKKIVENAEKRKDVCDKKSPERSFNNNSPSQHFTTKRLETTKKSMSSPAMNSTMPQIIPESPSMGALSTKLNDLTQDNSITSEPSETTTTTTTSEDVVTVCKDIVQNNDVEFETKPDDEEKVDDINGETREDSPIPLPVPSTKEVSVESQDVYQIVDVIRRNTNLSFELSCEALRVVLSSMDTLFPDALNPYLEAVAVHLTDKLEAPKELLGNTHDAKRLQYIFFQLADCKNDVEQRTWMLYEDEEDIKQFLEELVDILQNADESISCYEMSCDQYQSLMNLVQYYQMEARWPIKRLLLKAFTAACHLDHIIVDILLTSVLPLEIVEDMKTHCSNLDLLKELTKVLTIIFSMGQPMPVNHQEQFGVLFVHFLLEHIEGNYSEIVIDCVITLLLAFNLQFLDFTQNVVIEAMQQIKKATTFTEKMLLLLNRGEDPVRILKHSSNSINSVLKMFVDLFSVPETASLFYTNDNKVLIDILVRQLSDLSAGDPSRRSYLELCRRILRNTNYQDHTHRKQDLMKIFTRIFCEETECSASDQQLVRDIANEFPQIFKA